MRIEEGQGYAEQEPGLILQSVCSGGGDTEVAEAQR